MKIELSKKERNIIGIVGVLIVVMPFVFTRIGYITFDADTGVIGDTIGGITAPFLGFFGSVLVYLALKAQIDANDEIKKQFEKQNNDQLFFRLIDGLNDRIINYSMNKLELMKSVEVSSYSALYHIAEEFREEMSHQCIDYGKYLLANIPEKIDEKFYINMIGLIYRYTDVKLEVKIKLANDLKNELISMNYNERWEYLKKKMNEDIIGVYEHNQFFKGIGSVYFYKTDYHMRYYIYSQVYSLMYKKHGAFLDSYLNIVKYLLHFVDNKEDNNFYIEYFKNSLSTFEKVLIFYFIADYTQDLPIKKLIEKYKLINYEDIKNSFFIDIPSKEEFEKELYNIYTFDITEVKH